MERREKILKEREVWRRNVTKEVWGREGQQKEKSNMANDLGLTV